MTTEIEVTAIEPVPTITSVVANCVTPWMLRTVFGVPRV